VKNFKYIDQDIHIPHIKSLLLSNKDLYLGIEDLPSSKSTLSGAIKFWA
jgi:hypothetical protein